MQNLRYPFPFLPVSGDVIDAASSKLKFSDLYDLAGSVNVGIYDYDTKAIATGSGNGKKFFVGHSSIHTKDSMDNFIFGLKNPKGDPYWAFKGSDVQYFEYSDSLKPRSESWALGYSGSEGCDLGLPNFQTDKMYGIRITLKGNAMTQLVGHEQTYDIYSDIVCSNSDECATGCQDTNVDCERILKQIATRTNESLPSKMVNLKARYVTNTYTAPSVFALNVYRVSLMDDGSNVALAHVQKAVTGRGEVKRTARVGNFSTYEVCDTSAPTQLVSQPAFAVPDECGVCPVGSSTVAGTKTWFVTRPLDGTEDLTSDANKDTFADTVGTAYSVATDALKTFVSASAGVAIVQLITPAATTLTALAADAIVLASETGVVCTLPTPPNPAAWADVGDAYNVSRQLCITLQRKDCTGGNKLADLQAYYTAGNFPSLDVDTLDVVPGDACEDTYTVTQYSEGCMTDACLAADTATFVDLGGYEESLWKVVEPEAPVYNASKRCGLVFTAEFDQKFIDECEFELGMDTTPYPIEFEVSWIVDELVGEGGSVCNFNAVTGKKLKSARPARQTGYGVLNQYIKYNVYEPFGQDYTTHTLRRVLDSNLRKQVDKTSDYRYYYLSFKVDRNNTNFDQKSEVVEATFAIPNNRPDKMVKFEQAVLSPLSKFGIVLKKRVDGVS